MNIQIIWTKIKRIVEETNEVKTFSLEIPEGFTWEEGAFTHLALEGFNTGEKPNRSLVRHMSICTLPEENVIGITTRIRNKRSEYKAILNNIEVGTKVAMFKTVSHVPLRRENKRIYLLSAGVGLATFRPLALKYFADPRQIESVHSINIDSTTDYLFTDVFNTQLDKKFTAQFVHERRDYYNVVKQLAEDQDGIFYIVGSDPFIVDSIDILTNKGISPEQIVLDKRESQREHFFQLAQDFII